MKTAKKTVLVWDLPTRLFHWLLVILVALAWATSEADGIFFRLHVFAGLGVLTLIVFRLFWGVVGGRYARFREFVRPWPVVRGYGRRLATLSAPRYVGHNPLGGWMVVALLGALAAVVMTGLFGADDEVAGPLAHLLAPAWADAMAAVHEAVTSVLGALVGLHVLGVVFHTLVEGDNLTRAMWTGTKVAPGDGPRLSYARVGLWRAALVLSLSIFLVWGVVA
jgi:cytochrome b